MFLKNDRQCFLGSRLGSTYAFAILHKSSHWSCVRFPRSPMSFSLVNLHHSGSGWALPSSLDFTQPQSYFSFPPRHIYFPKEYFASRCLSSLESSLEDTQTIGSWMPVSAATRVSLKQKLVSGEWTRNILSPIWLEGSGLAILLSRCIFVALLWLERPSRSILVSAPWSWAGDLHRSQLWLIRWQSMPTVMTRSPSTR